MSKFNSYFKNVVNEAYVNKQVNEGYEQNVMHTPGTTIDAYRHIDSALADIKRFCDWTEFGSKKVAPLKTQAIKVLRELQAAIQHEIRTNKQYRKYSEDLMADDDGEEYIPGKGWRQVGAG